MEQKEFKRIKANWHKMEEKDIRGILEEILYEVLAEPEELMLKYAKDEEQMKAILHGKKEDYWYFIEKEEDDEGISRLRISKEEDRELTYVEVNDLLWFGKKKNIILRFNGTVI